MNYEFFKDDIPDRDALIEVYEEIVIPFGELGYTSHMGWGTGGGSALFKLNMSAGYVGVSCAFTEAMSEVNGNCSAVVNIENIEEDLHELGLSIVSEADLENILLNAGLEPVT